MNVAYGGIACPNFFMRRTNSIYSLWILRRKQWVVYVVRICSSQGNSAALGASGRLSFGFCARVVRMELSPSILYVLHSLARNCFPLRRTAQRKGLRYRRTNRRTDVGRVPMSEMSLSVRWPRRSVQQPAQKSLLPLHDRRRRQNSFLLLLTRSERK